MGKIVKKKNEQRIPAKRVKKRGEVYISSIIITASSSGAR
jgi:hypothetical protein